MRDDIKEIQGGLSKLKYELQTDKKFTDLDGIGKIWSNMLNIMAQRITSIV